MSRYFMDQDDDGHWYVVPDFLEVEWSRFKNHPEDCEMPEGVERIGGWPGLVRFKEYRIE